MTIGVQETLDALETANQGMMLERHALKYALRSLFCCSHDQFQQFDSLFDDFWDQHIRVKNRSQMRILAQPKTVERNMNPLQLIGNEKEEQPEEDGEDVSGASALERLRRTDLSQLPVDDMKRLEAFAEVLWRQMNMRLTRRFKAIKRKEQLNLRKTIRQSISSGGEPFNLSFRGRERRKPRLVLFLDISGSMDKYSYFFLKFIYALQKHFEQVESFLFSTELTRVTELLQRGQIQLALQEISSNAESWSSGTRIGVCLRDFNQNYARRILARNSIVVILSDGLDTGEPGLFANEILRMKQRTRKLIWLNPLLGMKDYEPQTRGLSAALPYIDTFVSAHNLDSLLKLERHLIHV